MILWRKNPTLPRPKPCLLHIVYIAENPLNGPQCVDSCPLTKFEGSLAILLEADVDAVKLPNSVATAALAK